MNDIISGLIVLGLLTVAFTGIWHIVSGFKENQG